MGSAIQIFKVGGLLKEVKLLRKSEFIRTALTIENNRKKLGHNPDHAYEYIECSADLYIYALTGLIHFSHDRGDSRAVLERIVSNLFNEVWNKITKEVEKMYEKSDVESQEGQSND